MPKKLSNGQDLIVFSIHVFPNPTQNKVYINSNHVLQKISVYNALGQQVYQSSNIKYYREIDFETFANGVYVIQFQSASGDVFSKRVV